MKFIGTVKRLARTQDIQGFHALLGDLSEDPGTFISVVKGFGSCLENQDICFCYSEGEVAFILMDADGVDVELADEEKFNDEVPLWFSESSHRVSPFARLKALMTGFLEMTRVNDGNVIVDSLCIIETQTNLINFDDYVEVYDNLGGSVFHSVKGFLTSLPSSDSNLEGRCLFRHFLDCCSMEHRLHDLFEPFRRYDGQQSPVKSGNAAAETSVEERPFDINNYFEERELDEFFALEDPDFKTTEEVVNAQTGEKMVVNKEADMPPVNILEPLVDPQGFLDEMVGLDQLKNNISEIVSYARYMRKVREKFPDYSHQPVNLHTIITGNPGTGKTTMCRIYGGLLHKAGVLSRGHTVVASRGSFIGQQFGTEELRMRQCLKLAQGGCLFIDEAGQLFSHPHPHDPGKGVIQLMLQLLAEEGNRDIAVVLALYANDRSLERLYDLNPGIKSRFVNVLSFPDYSLHELMCIARRKIKAQGLSFTPKAWQRFCAILKNTFDNKDKNYGNAREVVNLLQRCVVRHAVRCEKHNITGDELLRINVYDIPDPQTVLVNRRVGFC